MAESAPGGIRGRSHPRFAGPLLTAHASHADEMDVFYFMLHEKPLLTATDAMENPPSRTSFA
jgi:hypothetical protein